MAAHVGFSSMAGSIRGREHGQVLVPMLRLFASASFIPGSKWPLNRQP